MNRGHCDVLVVGAGPVGLTAAAELRRRDIDVRCVDAAAHHNVSTKALGLQARTLELFERLGVVEEAVARGLPVRRFNILSEEHRIAEFDLGNLDTPYPYLLMLPQNKTEELLRDRLEELGGEVEHGVDVVRSLVAPGGAGGAEASTEDRRIAWRRTHAAPDHVPFRVDDGVLTIPSRVAANSGGRGGPVPVAVRVTVDRRGDGHRLSDAECRRSAADGLWAD